MIREYDIELTVNGEMRVHICFDEIILNPTSSTIFNLKYRGSYVATFYHTQLKHKLQYLQKHYYEEHNKCVVWYRLDL